jgi:hypothetical protein
MPAACALPISSSTAARRSAVPASRRRSVRAAAAMSLAPRPSRLAFSHQSRRGRSTASISGQ